MTMKFIMKADIIFEADDIDDAFEKLIRHFEHLLNGGIDPQLIDPQLIENGNIVIKPKE